MLKTVQSGAVALKIHELQMANVGNNIANINTSGYKADEPMANFTDAVRQALSDSGITTRADAEITPELATGRRIIAMTKKDFEQGILNETGRSMDLAIDGDGFFGLADPANDGRMVYSRTGNFGINKEGKIVNESGLYIPDITVPANTKEIKVAEDGKVTAVSNEGDVEDIGQIKLHYFENNSYLRPVGENVFEANENVTELENPGVSGNIRQGYLEQSNVNIVDEMTKMITVQKAYSFSSRAVSTADEMWGIANSLRR